MTISTGMCFKISLKCQSLQEAKLECHLLTDVLHKDLELSLIMKSHVWLVPSECPTKFHGLCKSLMLNYHTIRLISSVHHRRHGSHHSSFVMSSSIQCVLSLPSILENSCCAEQTPVERCISGNDCCASQ